MRGLAVSFGFAALLLAACDRAPSGPVEQPTIRVEGPGMNAATANQAAPPANLDGLDFPILIGRIVDQAEILAPAEETSLEDLIYDLQGRTTDQLAIVTVTSLQGASIADYGRALGTRWGMGRTSSDNGVLLIVAPRERQARIEVGAGLRRILTDSLAQQIVDRDLIPHFRERRWYEGIDAGTRAIAAALRASADLPRGEVYP